MAKPLPMPEYLTCYMILCTVGGKFHMVINPDPNSNGAWLSENEAQHQILVERLRSVGNTQYAVFEIEWPTNLTE